MKAVNFIILCLFFFNCKSQESVLHKKLENSFNEYIVKSRENQSDAETERYLNNEAKFILQARKELFSNIQLEENADINLVEIFYPEMPSSLYTSVLKSGSKYYFLKKNDQFETFFHEIEFDSFKKEYQTLACILIEMDKIPPNKLTRNPRESSYHFTVYITKVSEDGSIKTYVPNDVCSL